MQEDAREPSPQLSSFYFSLSRSRRLLALCGCCQLCCQMLGLGFFKSLEPPSLQKRLFRVQKHWPQSTLRLLFALMAVHVPKHSESQHMPDLGTMSCVEASATKPFLSMEKRRLKSSFEPTATGAFTTRQRRPE